MRGAIRGAEHELATTCEKEHEKRKCSEIPNGTTEKIHIELESGQGQLGPIIVHDSRSCPPCPAAAGIPIT